MSVIERIKKRVEKEMPLYASEWKKNLFNIIDEELAKEPQGDIPVQCVDGSCPMALAEEYADCGMDVVHSCDECQYKPAKEPQECKWTKGINSVETCWGDID